MTDGEPQEVNFEIHRRMEFSSERKRMGVFITDPTDGLHKIYAKGADSEIKLRLDKDQINDKILDHLDDFLVRSSVRGLRTLLYGVRVLDEDEYKQFCKDIATAEDDILNSDKLLQQVFDEWERDFVLLGGTAVEDRLQDDVPQILESFRIAGIKVWMLTGDKMETAKNIGFSCKLLTDEMVLFEIKGADMAREKFTQAIVDDNESMMHEMKKRGIVIDAEAFSYL